MTSDLTLVSTIPSLGTLRFTRGTVHERLVIFATTGDGARRSTSSGFVALKRLSFVTTQCWTSTHLGVTLNERGHLVTLCSLTRFGNPETRVWTPLVRVHFSASPVILGQCFIGFNTPKPSPAPLRLYVTSLPQIPEDEGIRFVENRLIDSITSLIRPFLKEGRRIYQHSSLTRMYLRKVSQEGRDCNPWVLTICEQVHLREPTNNLSPSTPAVSVYPQRPTTDTNSLALAVSIVLTYSLLL